MPAAPKIILVIEDSRAHGRALLRGIYRYAKLHGPWSFYRDVYNPSYGHGVNIRKEVSLRFEKLDADGLITRNPSKTRTITEKGVPTIIAITQNNIPSDTPYVTINHQAVGQMAAEYFLEKGYRNFAFCGYRNMAWSQTREDAFFRPAQEHGYQTIRYQAPSPNELKRKSLSSEVEHIARWLESLPAPTALMACNDNRAVNVIEATKMSNVRVPEDVALLGVDNDDLICDMCNPALSSILLNAEQGGYEAAALLDRLLHGECPPNPQVLIEPVKVITRGSTDITAIEDTDIADAMQFIKAHRQYPIQVKDVVEHICSSRRHLQKKFRKHLNRTILEEIKNCRVEYAKELLLGSDMSISEITDHMNFTGMNSFSRFFKNETSMSPLEYRKRFENY